MNHLEENHEDELSLFSPPPANTGIQRREWIEFRPTNQISADAPLDFSIPPQSAAYMDLKKSVLKVKLRLLKADGTSVAKDTNVALVNLPLQALFSEMECTLQQTPVAQMGSNYPFKAYIDTLLETGANDKVVLHSQLFERHGWASGRGQRTGRSEHGIVPSLFIHTRRQDPGDGRPFTFGRVSSASPLVERHPVDPKAVAQ